MVRILIVDDENKICQFIKAYLEKENYIVDIANDGLTALKEIEKNMYDVIILDRMLPDLSGEEVCIEVRKKSRVPILMLSAKSEDEDKIDGFELGCDDYLSKPFNIKELILRIKVILKRNKESIKDRDLQFSNGLKINPDSHEVFIDGELVELTNTEFKLLYLMASKTKQVFTREILIESIMEGNQDKLDRVIDSHIKNLRCKLQTKKNKLNVIKTIYGVGYKFDI